MQILAKTKIDAEFIFYYFQLFMTGKNVRIKSAYYNLVNLQP